MANLTSPRSVVLGWNLQVTLTVPLTMPAAGVSRFTVGGVVSGVAVRKMKSPDCATLPDESRDVTRTWYTVLGVRPVMSTV